ncbi:2OG-Fe(II) oxygenase [Actinomadura sp. DC4]|uniref:2OG-Fe(II)-dependent halogenase WelO5 family protein n=1 Tax=Actinomadura sp. DC4 TaxID=3055069 RepID=UPI0025AFA1DB|nr:2OG-Fe(II) oxygenase [Actinomadura sp. DC4]MDN3358163.1 2OG-Fe(II) oxygenase [Actinomadura sp. DC4]
MPKTGEHEDTDSVTSIGDPLFDVLTPDPADARRAFQCLAAGTMAALRFPELLDPAWCASLLDRLGKTEFDAYDEARLWPRILKLGPALYDHYTDGVVAQDYWDRAESARELWRTATGGLDPTELIRRRFADLFSVPVRPATLGGRELFAGILREFPSGSLIHYDEVAREYAGRLDEEPIVQLAFNCYLRTSEQGGELTVWRHRWVPSDEEHRHGYGWEEEAVRAAPSVTLRARDGEGIIFDCRHFHQVAEPSGRGRRVTLSFFMGCTLTGEILIWS